MEILALLKMWSSLVYVIPILCLLQPAHPTADIDGTSLQELKDLILHMNSQLSEMDARLKLLDDTIRGSLETGKISSISSKRLTSTSFEIDWKQPVDTPCITKYTVMWEKSSGGEKHAITVSEPPYTITDLTACTDYNITVTTCTEKGPAKISDTLTTVMDVAGKVSRISSKRLNSTSFEVEWSKPSDTPCTTKYTLMGIKKSGGEKHMITVSEPKDTITILVYGLDACADYNITVTAYTEMGPGEPSDTLTTGIDVSDPVDASNGFEMYNDRLIRRTKKSDPKDFDYYYKVMRDFCTQYDAKPMIPRTAQDYQLYKDVQESLGKYESMWLPASDRAEEGTLRWYTDELASDSISHWDWKDGEAFADNSDSNRNSCLVRGYTLGVYMSSCTGYHYPPICEKICG